MMAKRFKQLGSMTLLGVAVTLALAACNKGEGSDAQKAASEAAAKAPTRLLSSADILTASIQPVADLLPFTATLNAQASTEVAAQSEGTVLAVLVREGEQVKRGQLLARIDNEALRQNVAEMQAQLKNDEARVKLAKLKRDKQKELFEQGFISRLAFDEFDNEYQLRAGELTARRSQLARAQKSLSEADVRAPMDGTVFARRTEPGEQAARNQKLFGIADLSVLEAVANVPSRLIGQLKVGQQARFSVEGVAGHFGATLARLNPVANAATRTFSVYLRVDNHDGRLKAGQFAKGGVVLQEVHDAVRLPLAAVQDSEGKTPWVMKVQNGHLQKQPVSIALRADTERAFAVRGLNAGDTLLAAALLGMKPGDAVQLPKR